MLSNDEMYKEADVFFPKFALDKFSEIQVDGIHRECQIENGISYQFKVYEKIN